MLQLPKRLALLPAGRVAKWFVLLGVSAVLTVLMPLAALAPDVADDSPESFLPRNAETTQVAERAKEFASNKEVPAIVVYTGEGEITAQDKAAVADERQRFERFSVGREVAPAELSEDGEAMMLTVLIKDHDDDAPNAVKEMREEIEERSPPGLDVKIAGPAGEIRDQIAVFDSLDITLLLASAAVVALLLLVIYRSPVLLFIPLIVVGIASRVANAVVYLLGEHAGLPVNSQSIGILTVLVFGVGTDYALLLIARYREELHRLANPHDAMREALRRCGPAVLASAATVAAGLLCLMAADLNSNRSLGLVGAVGIGCAFLVTMTLLPVLLLVFGRRGFWPFIPRYGTPVRKRGGVWDRIGSLVSARPRSVWLAAVVVTAGLAVGALGIQTGLDRSEQFRDKPESVAGQELIARHYPAGSANPAEVYAKASAEKQVLDAVRGVPGVEAVEKTEKSTDGEQVLVPVVLKDSSDSAGAEKAVDELREAVHALPGADAKVGGDTATAMDMSEVAAQDRQYAIPLVLGVVLIILILLLRSLVAPLLLMGTVVLSYLAALGASWLLFDHVLDFHAVDDSWALTAFVFLVALGVDYNIFLMHRIREEVRAKGHHAGVRAGLTSTGSVITSAGVVLAATFAVVATLPQVSMAEIGTVVAVGVLLDTFLVRSLMVPALALDAGERTWWPGRTPVRRTGERGEGEGPGEEPGGAPAPEREPSGLARR